VNSRGGRKERMNFVQNGYVNEKEIPVDEQAVCQIGAYLLARKISVTHILLRFIYCIVPLFNEFTRQS